MVKKEAHKSVQVFFIFILALLLLPFSFLIFLFIPTKAQIGKDTFSHIKPTKNEPKTTTIQSGTPPPNRIERFKISEENLDGTYQIGDHVPLK